MAVTRRNRLGRRPTRVVKRKPWRSTRRRMRMSRPLSRKPHLFRRMCVPVTLTNTPSQGGWNIDATTGTMPFTFGTVGSDSNGTYTIPFSAQFLLSYVQGSTEFTNLFDRYRICKVVVKIINLSNSATVNGQGLLPTIMTSMDYDDSAVPSASTLQSFMQRGDVKETRLSGTKTIVLRPRPAMSLYQGAFTGYAIPGKAPYINSANPDVPHYGFKGFLRNVNLNPNTTSQTAFRFDTYVYFACKDLM